MSSTTSLNSYIDSWDIPLTTLQRNHAEFFVEGFRNLSGPIFAFPHLSLSDLFPGSETAELLTDHLDLPIRTINALPSVSSQAAMMNTCLPHTVITSARIALSFVLAHACPPEIEFRYDPTTFAAAGHIPKHQPAQLSVIVHDLQAQLNVCDRYTAEAALYTLMQVRLPLQNSAGILYRIENALEPWIRFLICLAWDTPPCTSEILPRDIFRTEIQRHVDPLAKLDDAPFPDNPIVAGALSSLALYLSVLIASDDCPEAYVPLPRSHLGDMGLGELSSVPSISQWVHRLFQNVHRSRSRSASKIQEHIRMRLIRRRNRAGGIVILRLFGVQGSCNTTSNVFDSVSSQMFRTLLTLPL